MKTVATILLGLALYVPVWAQNKPKLAELTILGDMLIVDGFWEPDNPTKQNEVVPTAVHIQCFSHGGKEANLVRTEAFCIAMAPSGLLMADFSLMEASWSDDEVVIIQGFLRSIHTSRLIGTNRCR